METTALRFHEFGDPLRVLRRDPITIAPPGAGQALLRLLASPINPSDLGSIAGSYGSLPALPAVAGREGIAEVLETGPETAGLASGQRVLLPEGQGAWQERILVDAGALIPVPQNVPTEQAAMAAINPPTAWLLLEKFVRLEPGDWIIQNAANSAVGHYVIQLCRQQGLRTINIVRRPEWIERLKNSGADEVFLDDDPDPAERVREITGARLPRLGLNAVGGQSAATLIKCLHEGGTLVTFGGMTGEPVRFPTRHLIFHDIRLVGFWLHRWKAQNPPSTRRALLNRMFALMEKGILHAPIEATFPLGGFPEAIEQASAPGRTGKILFVGTG